ncbi:glycopeptide [Desarmillaria tabescens]|uniref:Glycopeptide n=1 Tax=Armillaria tabescens TaxID=1929756 RepID=A0AA39TPI5_ARMTA|nr:glycopeptide [Desarmillaria tabescens]KAK0466077.1 glycopeptide [Desarmillaria tabescens]
MFSKIISLAAVVFVSCVTLARAESHTVRFVNRCGRGTPTLSQNFNTLSTGSDYTAGGPFVAAVAWLDTGCGFQGSGCTLVELTLKNPTSPGAGSSVDISLIPPHTFNVPASFSYFNGCDGQGKSCSNANCPPTDAFHVTTDYGAQVQCEANNVGLTITFC